MMLLTIAKALQDKRCSLTIRIGIHGDVIFEFHQPNPAGHAVKSEQRVSTAQMKEAAKISMLDPEYLLVHRLEDAFKMLPEITAASKA